MTTSEILSLGTLNKAYNTLLPIVQEFKNPNYTETKEDKAIEHIFLSISLAKTSPKFLRGTLEDAINSAKRTAQYKGLIIE